LQTECVTQQHKAGVINFNIYNTQKHVGFGDSRSEISGCGVANLQAFKVSQASQHKQLAQPNALCNAGA
jgi:hypothetical protein